MTGMFANFRGHGIAYQVKGIHALSNNFGSATDQHATHISLCARLSETES